MTLALTFVLLTLALAVVFWGVGLFLQGYLYNEPADRMPLRAVAAGLLVGGFLTLWVYVNTRTEPKDRYGTFFEFSPTSPHPFDAFDAVRRRPGTDEKGNPKETTVAYKKVGTRFVEARDTSRPFRMNTADDWVVAVEVPDGDRKVRYDAELTVDGKYLPGSVRVFREAGGRRFIEFGQSGAPSPVFAPSRGALIGALALNAGHFLAWLAAFWLTLRFSFGHAVGLAACLGLAVMLFLMPLLFDTNRRPAVVASPPVVRPAEK